MGFSTFGGIFILPEERDLNLTGEKYNDYRFSLPQDWGEKWLAGYY